MRFFIASAPRPDPPLARLESGCLHSAEPGTWGKGWGLGTDWKAARSPELSRGRRPGRFAAPWPLACLAP